MGKGKFLSTDNLGNKYNRVINIISKVININVYVSLNEN